MHRCSDRRIRSLGILMLAGLFLAGTAFADDCDHTGPREASVDAGGATKVTIEAEAGSLRVVGREGLGEVRAWGDACASKESLLEDIELSAERRGERVVIVAATPHGRWGDETARLDLEVEVPAHLALAIEDGSGALEVRGVASADIEDGSGEIRVEDVRGDLRIDDGSANIDVVGVSGEVRIEDGSGEITVRRAGSVRIDEDGSGGIEVSDVDGDVTVHEDGSGGIDVRNVGGDFTVDDDGSGGIRHHNVAGRVRVPDEDRD